MDNYIESVGYDLYVKLLSEAVLEERGEKPTSEAEATVDIKVSAHIPEKYIKVSSQRMEMYKKISLITDRDDMQDILDEFIDRFGEPPREVVALIRISLIRALAARFGISRVEARDSSLIFVMEKPDLEIWSEVFASFKNISFRPMGQNMAVFYRMGKGDECENALSVLQAYEKTYNKLAEEK